MYEIVLHKVGEGMLLCIYEGSNELIRENVVLDQEVNNLFMLNVQHKTVQILVNTRLF